MEHELQYATIFKIKVV